MNDDAGISRERSAFGALAALLLAPVVAHGLWRPLVNAFGAAGSARAITTAALAVCGAVVAARRLGVRQASRLAAVPGGLVALIASVGLSLGLAGFLTLLSVASTTALLERWLLPRLPTSIDGLSHGRRALTGLYVAAALAALVSTARVSVFMGDPTEVNLQVLPGETFLETHSCLTAYVRAAALSRQRVENLYDPRWWSGAHGVAARADGAPDPYRPFTLDNYAYPPPFLIVMAPLAPLEGDFFAQRALWFGLNGVLLACALWVVARWLDGPGAHRVLLLSPLFFASLPVLGTLQVGNFQVAVVMVAVLAMVAFDRGRAATGGALLALAILSKISPAVLCVVLLAQRRWRPIAWTALFFGLFVALSALTFGVNPLRHFVVTMLPRLASGDAFSFLDDAPFSILTNTAPFGLPFKLGLMGIHVSEPWAIARHVGRVYSVALLALAAVAALRPRGDRRAQAVTWMCLLVLGALQSPFAPSYSLIALLWAMCLLSVEVRRARGGVALALLWVALNVVPRWPAMSLYAAHSVLQSVLALMVPAWLILRVARPRDGLTPLAERAP